MPVPPPYPLAMIICDTVVTDPTTGKKTLFGLFSGIGAEEFPAVQPLITIYIAVTDGRGSVSLKLRIVDADEELDPLFERELTVELTDPRSIGELVMSIQNVAFPKPGEYRFQLYANGEFLIERRMFATLPPSSQKDHE